MQNFSIRVALIEICVLQKYPSRKVRNFFLKDVQLRLPFVFSVNWILLIA